MNTFTNDVGIAVDGIKTQDSTSDVNKFSDYPDSFTKGPSRTRRQIIVGALGPEKTSTHAAARLVQEELSKENLDVGIQLFRGFEQQRKSLDGCEIGLGVVPAAWKDVNDYFFTRNFRNAGCFELPTPPYGLIKNDWALRHGNRILLSHPAPSRIIPALLEGIIGPESLQVEFVSSTSVVAERVAHGEAAFGVTNLEAAEKFGLEFIREYGPIDMLWILFARQDNDFRAIERVFPLRRFSLRVTN